RSRLIWILTGSLAAQGLACGSKPAPARPAPPDEDGPAGYRSAPYEDEEEDESLAVEGLRGRLEQADIQAGIEPHADALSRCYTDRVGRDNRYLGGAVELSFVVSPDGSVKTVHLAASDLGAWPMEECMLGVA